MRGRLRLTLDRDGDDIGELQVEAAAGGFSGVSSAYFDLASLGEFAEALNAFPLPRDEFPHIEGGFWGPEPGELQQCHVSLTVCPVDRRGSLGIRVRLAEPIWADDDPARKSHVQFELPADYAVLQRFSRDLRRLVDGVTDEIVLEYGP
jgi:hypothetical protein